MLLNYLIVTQTHEELKKHKTKKPFKMKSEASTNIFFPCSQKSNYQNCSEYVANYSAP